jgi:hypothetical protein
MKTDPPFRSRSRSPPTALLPHGGRRDVFPFRGSQAGDRSCALSFREVARCAIGIFGKARPAAAEVDDRNRSGQFPFACFAGFPTQLSDVFAAPDGCIKLLDRERVVAALVFLSQGFRRIHRWCDFSYRIRLPDGRSNEGNFAADLIAYDRGNGQARDVSGRLSTQAGESFGKLE